MSNIYQIGQEHMRIFQILEENEGELTPELQLELEEIMKSGDDKLKACYYVYSNLGANLAGIEKELKRITALKKSNENSMNRLKSIMEQFLKVTGRDRFEDGVVKMVMANKKEFSYSVFPPEFVEKLTVEKERLQEFKDWAKLNPETAEDMYGAKFTDVKYIQIK